MPYTGIVHGVSPNRQDLVERLVEEMDHPHPTATPDIPDIQENRTQLTDHYDVWVIWDAWRDVPMEERGRIILEAYIRKFGQGTEKVQHMSYAMGVTREEAEKLGLLDRSTP